MNRENFARVRDRIAEAGNEHCYMGSWVSREFIDLPGSGPIECGTTACIAGHTMAVAEGKFRLQGNTSLGIISTAKRYLGIRTSVLFYTENWPNKYREILQAEGEAKGMLAILDDCLLGTLDPNTMQTISLD